MHGRPAPAPCSRNAAFVQSSRELPKRGEGWMNRTCEAADHYRDRVAAGVLPEQRSSAISVGGVEPMRKLLLAALCVVSVAACQTPTQTAGTATGVVAGAAVG